ncbi:hypothetical protein GOP47_0005939 [Adiantum capillus-veneris]|uniref:Uncharacterized protein n=1 Tax=Adiantum capillus-veneris TaxID=13818 RepID=A0A9D4V251_ADICA|nr:hypothetical protein GOP47_0005939 [Adiantum capillus-veneris]
MAFFCRSALRGKGRTLQDALLRTSKPASHQGLASAPSESGGHFSARAFSSLLSKWQESGKPIGEACYFVKPCERRKLAKHYKKLNRAKRELFDKLDTARHHMETVRETHRRNKQERKEAKAAAAAAETVAAAAAVAKSQTTG